MTECSRSRPACLATWQDGAWDSRAYWILDQHRCTTKNLADVGEQLGDVLLEATQRHLISDVPIVLFLSGGADSACLGALARKRGHGERHGNDHGFCGA